MLALTEMSCKLVSVPAEVFHQLQKSFSSNQLLLPLLKAPFPRHINGRFGTTDRKSEAAESCHITHRGELGKSQTWVLNQRQPPPPPRPLPNASSLAGAPSVKANHVAPHHSWIRALFSQPFDAEPPERTGWTVIFVLSEAPELSPWGGAELPQRHKHSHDARYLLIISSVWVVKEV